MIVTQEASSQAYQLASSSCQPRFTLFNTILQLPNLHVFHLTNYVTLQTKQNKKTQIYFILYYETRFFPVVSKKKTKPMMKPFPFFISSRFFFFFFLFISSFFNFLLATYYNRLPTEIYF